MWIFYADDFILWETNDDDIHDLEMEPQDLGVDLEQEYYATGFLGVNLDQDLKTGLLETIQTRLIQRIIESVCLDDGMSKDKFTPSESKPLVKDKNGELESGMFRYSSVVGMLLCMSGHTRPYVDL